MSKIDELKPGHYPIVTLGAGLDYLEARRSKWSVGDSVGEAEGKDESYLQERDAEESYDPSSVTRLSEALHRLVLEFPAEVAAVKQSRNEFDLEASKMTYEHLKGMPVAVLLDKDFWRYLVLHELFPIVIWRIPDSGKDGWLSNFAVGSNWPRCYPYKSYLRGQLISTVRELGYPWTDTADVDFYDSHLFSSRNGLIPSVASALNSIRQEVPTSRALQPYVSTAVRFRATHATELLEPTETVEVLRRYSKRNSKKGDPR